jgi:hypothetical protein
MRIAVLVLAFICSAFFQPDEARAQSRDACYSNNQNVSWYVSIRSPTFRRDVMLQPNANYRFSFGGIADDYYVCWSTQEMAAECPNQQPLVVNC